MLDEIWVVTAPVEQVVARVQAKERAGRDGHQVANRFTATERERIEHADAVIDNSGSLEGLKRK